MEPETDDRASHWRLSRRLRYHPRNRQFFSLKSVSVIYTVGFVVLWSVPLWITLMGSDWFVLREEETGIFIRYAPSIQEARRSAISFYKYWDAKYSVDYTTRLVMTNINVMSSQDGRRKIDQDERMPQATFLVKERAFSLESAAPYLEMKVCNEHQRSGVEYGGYLCSVAVLAFSRDALERLSNQDLIDIIDMLKNVNFNSIYLTYLD